MTPYDSCVGASYPVTGAWKHCGLIASAPTSESNGPGSSPGWGHCVVFFNAQDALGGVYV